MTIYEANKLLNNSEVKRIQLLKCLEDLCKEYGYIQGMIIANFRDLTSNKKTLNEMQLLIEQLKERLI